MSVTLPDTVIGAVLAAQRRGESVIATDADKVPWYPWKRYQTEPADAAQLMTWAKNPRTTGFALITGTVSGTVVIDFDALGVPLVERHGLHPHVRTGSGGFHLRVRHPGFYVATQNSKVTKALAARYPGVDIRGDGGYAIQWGSSAIGAYEPLRDLADVDPISVLPEPMSAALGLLGADALADLGIEGEENARGADGRFHKGHRHRHLVEVASAMAGRGHSEAEILAELRRVNETDCEPAHGDAHVRETAADIHARYGKAPPEREQRHRDEHERLERLLRLSPNGLHIKHLRLVGNGPSAALVVTLGDGEEIEAERFGDLWTVGGLTRFVTQHTGVTLPGLTKAEAEEANALIRRLSDVQYATRVGDLGREHGVDFLRQATVLTLDMTDQSERYAAFTRLEALDPVRAADEHGGPTVASCCTVLQHTGDGTRLVHCGWLFSHVRHAGRVSHPAELARRMELAGWERAGGRRGRVKATSVGGLGAPIVLPFWRVPRDWEAM
jgi:hypothetical protein